MWSWFSFEQTLCPTIRTPEEINFLSLWLVFIAIVALDQPESSLITIGTLVPWRRVLFHVQFTIFNNEFGCTPFAAEDFITFLVYPLPEVRIDPQELQTILSIKHIISFHA
jgi:hypothetical protein